MTVFKASTVLHYLVIAIAEEVHFRKFQFEYLKKQIGIWMAIIISSMIFAFIFHLNDSIIENFVIRLPLGIILGVVKLKFGLNKPIYIHWIYDVIVSGI
jgi:membrane protease YdiL (CAAX protease family)